MSTQRKSLCSARVSRSNCVARRRNPAWLPGSALCVLTVSFSVPATAGNLPVPCIAAGSCGVTGPATWVTSGAATATQTANQLTVNQTSQNAILNWQSFNIGSGSSVNFVQPNSTALAINNIFQGNPSQIFGSLTANGRVYLINQNGIMFGAGAQVNVGSLVASSLNITPAAITDIATTPSSGTNPTTPSFVLFTDASGNPLPSGDVKVAQGASLTSTASGGQIFLFAPNVTNEGTISTPNGQTILAAGNQVYLAVSPDANVRGLTVAVDAGGTATNGSTSNASVTDPSQLVGQIVAQHGNVTLMGLAVNQLGRISANTSVEENGTIMLVAADRSKGGSVTLGANSVTEAPLDTTDTTLAVDQTVQQKSTITIQGNNIDVGSGANITATSGVVNILASAQGLSGSTNAGTLPPNSSTSDGSRLYIADDATIDVSGATATLPMSANSLQVQLRGSELADDANQRNGALRGQSVTVDVRQYGTLDGTSWVGTPLADLSADFATIQRGILQRNETGGTVSLQSLGDVIVGSNVKVNVSGGATNYQSGYLNTSALLGANGQVYSISNASPDVVYTGVANTNVLSLTDLRWGVTSTYAGIYGTGQGQYVPGYVQGANAGGLTLNAPHILFDGDLVANVQVGPYQRNLQVSGSTTQQYDQLPLPGALTLGSSHASTTYPDLMLQSIDLAPSPVLESVRNADGTQFNPLTDPWPASLTATSLNPDLIGTNAAGRIALFANGTISVPSNVDLELPLDGSFSATATGINFAGKIASPGASVTLQAEPTVGNPEVFQTGVTIEPTAVIDVAGAWVNDNPAVTPEPATAPLPLNGGSVTIAARDGNVTLSRGAVIDVSGGAHELASGTITAGTPGSISISTSQPDQNGAEPFAPTSLTLGATLRGYGVQDGGSLSLSASSFCVTSGGACGPLSANQTSTGTVTLAPDFFTTGGFGSYSLSANFGGLEVTSGTQLSPVQENFILPPDSLLPSAPTLSGVAPLGVLPEIQRQPVDLSLSAQYVSPIGGNAIAVAEFATAPTLSLDQGSSIVLDPLGKVSLTSNTSIFDDGSIVAPGGAVSMTVTAGLNESNYIAGHQLWLGSDSIIDVSGTVQAVTNDLGQTQGTVLPGGSVTLTADRGAVEAQQGSFIDVSGTTGVLDIQQVQSNGATTFVPTTVASAGGSVSIQAAEAVLLSGTMSAASADPTTVANGSFSLVLDGNGRYANTPALPNDPVLPLDYQAVDGAREIQIANTQAPVAIAAGADLPIGLDGQALVSSSALAAAGFDSVTLRAVSFNNSIIGAQPLVSGIIQFNGNVSLGAGRSLTLDAASFLSTGGKAAVSAPYVSLGQSQVLTQGGVGTTKSGTGTLTVYGDLIDLTGNTAFGGFSTVALDSTGDIRANGVVPKPPSSGPLDSQAPGALTVSGELDLTAQQIYPSTLTSYSFTSGAGGSGDINIQQAAGTAAPTLLSAGGSLTFNAPDIAQSGTVRAPLGSIAMNATNITLAPGSVTSTSADGQTIPFGTTQGGFDWVYPLYGSGGSLVYGTDGIPLPTQSIQLSGTSVNIAKGATIDVKGGGDLLATEFIPGPTGTVDVLAGSSSFAILPTSDLRFAPNDPYYSSGSGVFAGETIYLAGGGGIPAGTYAVLPARYALLPGAYYVTPESGFQDLTPGQHISQTDGSVIVAGYMSYAGTGLGASARTSGFDVEPGTAVQNLAEYTLTSANAYFTAQAATAGVSVQRLPQDAGYLELSATSQLTLDATLEATPGKGGLGAAVDISSSAIRVVNGEISPGSDPGFLDLDANSLSQLGAQSILLGGVRSQTSSGFSINTEASTVEVAAGATLEAPEVLLVASNTVTVDGGATVGTSGTLPTPESALSLSGDGVLLRVAAAGDPVTTRTGTSGSTTAGQLVLMPGSVIAATGGSVGVDVTSSADFTGTLQLTGGSLSISGSQVSLGNVPDGTMGIVLPANVLDGLSLANLSVASRGSIDFYDGADLSATNVTLSSGALRGCAALANCVALTPGGSPQSPATAEVSATDMLTLVGATSVSTARDTGTGTGTLALNGGSVSLEAGFLDISGFSNASIASQGLLNLSGTGNWTAEGNLNMQAGLLSADSGATWKLNVTDGAFAYNPTPNPAAIKAPAQIPLGASLAIQADSIAFNGAAQLHAGELFLTADGATGGDITLGGSASIDLSAISVVFDGKTEYSPAGVLSLQSQQGSISALAGSVINVSAVDDSVANAGAFSAQAANGSINLNGSLLGSNADVSVDAQSLGNAPALEAALVAGGFTGDWNLRLRGPGDLVVPTGTANAIVGRSVSLTADQGNIDVEGSITSDSASGGSITLSAGNNVVVNGTLDARPQSSSQMNGQIELTSENGGVMVGSAAIIEAYDPSVATQSVADGGLLIRAPQTSLDTLLPGSTSPAALVLAGNLQGLRSVTIEGFQAYTDNTGTLDPSSALVSQMNSDAANFMANAPALVSALGTVKGPTPQIVPGIEIDSNQSLTLDSNWNLSTFRPGGVAGFLTIRSAGDLTFNGSLSDGFASATATALTSTGPSWSYRLAAGADLSSANVMAVQPTYAFTSSTPPSLGTGSLTVGTGNSTLTAETMIRTGTGSIDIAAANDVTLANQYSVIYTAGIAEIGDNYRGRGQFGTTGLNYPTEGGDVSISAGRDVGYAAGQYSTDLVTNWLWRVGTDEPTTGKPLATAWTVNFADFAQGVGALGGGNVTVTAGDNVSDLSVSVPTIGYQANSSQPFGTAPQVLNEGNILVRAGGSVEGGSLYEGAGSAVVIAGDKITASTSVAGLYPVVLLGDASVTLSARAGATLSGVANPTLLPQAAVQSVSSGNNYSYFSTYGENSAITLQTTTGEAELVNDTSSTGALVSTYGTGISFDAGGAIANNQNLDPAAALRIYPGTVTVDSLRGTLTVDSSFGLFPEANGTLNLLAQGAVVLGSATGTGQTFEIIQSNADPAVLPTAANPQAVFDNVQLQLDSLIDSVRSGIVTNASVPLHLTGSAPDSTLSRIVSLTGDVSMDSTQQSLISFAAPAQIVAGQDLVNLSVDFTNLESTDVSALIAGRDITYPLTRLSSGAINPNNQLIDIEGPGTLEVIAGRNINLGTSLGITSQGNLQDPFLTGGGATVSLEAGVGSPDGQNYSTFITDYLTNSTLYTTDLVAYMQPFLGGSPTPAQALAAFKALPTAQQTPLIQTIFFDELLASGNAAAASGSTHNNFTRGYGAIETLFQNSVPSLSGNQPSPYSGDITLYFSRVYTLDGGDVNLLAPGGGVNAGLATEPSAFGVQKPASELGIVAQSTGTINAYTYGDFEVNESRVFAADGGDITVWSTDGNIDAGRGAKTAISAPPPTITYVNGLPEVVFPAALTGSGIQALATTPGVDAGTVSLFAPNGVVNANDAGIVAGNLTIAATAVLGANNIKVSGVSIGVPVETGGLGASLAGVSAVASSASQAATAAVEESSNRNASIAPVTEAALGWLDVFIEGFGADVCKPTDAECLKHQAEEQH